MSKVLILTMLLSTATAFSAQVNEDEFDLNKALEESKKKIAAQEEASRIAQADLAKKYLEILNTHKQTIDDIFGNKIRHTQPLERLENVLIKFFGENEVDLTDNSPYIFLIPHPKYRGQNINKDFDPLRIAALLGSKPLIKLLIFCRADVNSVLQGTNFLTFIAEYCPAKELIIKYLLSLPQINTDLQNLDKSTCLYRLVDKMFNDADDSKTIAVIKLLIDAGADFSSDNFRGVSIEAMVKNYDTKVPGTNLFSRALVNKQAKTLMIIETAKKERNIVWRIAADGIIKPLEIFPHPLVKIIVAYSGRY